MTASKMTPVETALCESEVSMKELLGATATRSARYAAGIADRRVAPRPEQIVYLDALGGALPRAPCNAAEVLALLDDVGSPATVATTGG